MFVLAAAVEAVQCFWRVTPRFEERRPYILNRKDYHVDRHAAFRIGAGLAVGFRGIGKLDDALLTAALTLVRYLPADCERCSSPLEVIFDPKLLDFTKLNELRKALEQSTRPTIDSGCVHYRGSK